LQAALGAHECNAEKNFVRQVEILERAYKKRCHINALVAADSASSDDFEFSRRCAH
jgi:hypothetical protein